MSSLGAPHSVVEAGLAGTFLLITTEHLLGEFERVLSEPRLANKIRAGHDLTSAYLERLRSSSAVVVEPTTRLQNVSRDPDDDRVIEAALAGDAAYIVTGDKDLLTLGTYEGIEIVTPARFLEVLAEHG